MSIEEFDPSILEKASGELGLDFVDARIQVYYSESILLDNGTLRELSANTVRGVGVRVLYHGSVGYSYTNSLKRESVLDAVKTAFKIAKALKDRTPRVELYERSSQKTKLSSTYMKDPSEIDIATKIGLLKDIYNSTRDIVSLSSFSTGFGFEKDTRIYVSTWGDYVEFTRVMAGIRVNLVASSEGKYETLHDSESSVAGWEFVESVNWLEWVNERVKLVLEALKAPHVKPGKYDIVLDNDMVGLMLHEAFGHASEGDIVAAGGSVLGGRIGDRVASENVSIIDDGLVPGGVYVPFDDEGTPKRKVYTVKNGVLTGFLHSLHTAKALRGEPTGNARVMGFRYPILVRQTNTYMEPGDWGPDEILRDTRNGLYVRGRGAMGGEVNPLTGAFTFTSGPSYIIENGEPSKLVKGVMLTGLILDTLKRVDAVGKDLVVRTSVFGGCGKNGQLVRVGDGGPHVRVRDFTIGGG